MHACSRLACVLTPARACADYIVAVAFTPACNIAVVSASGKLHYFQLVQQDPFEYQCQCSCRFRYIHSWSSVTLTLWL